MLTLKEGAHLITSHPSNQISHPKSLTLQNFRVGEQIQCGMCVCVCVILTNKPVPRPTNRGCNWFHPSLPFKSKQKWEKLYSNQRRPEVPSSSQITENRAGRSWTSLAQNQILQTKLPPPPLPWEAAIPISTFLGVSPTKHSGTCF